MDYDNIDTANLESQVKLTTHTGWYSHAQIKCCVAQTSFHIFSNAETKSCRNGKPVASFPDPAQLSVACSPLFCTEINGKLGRAWERG